jgi:hypothetical protein
LGEKQGALRVSLDAGSRDAAPPQAVRHDDNEERLAQRSAAPKEHASSIVVTPDHAARSAVVRSGVQREKPARHAPSLSSAGKNKALRESHAGCRIARCGFAARGPA